MDDWKMIGIPFGIAEPLRCELLVLGRCKAQVLSHSAELKTS